VATPLWKLCAEVTETLLWRPNVGIAELGNDHLQHQEKSMSHSRSKGTALITGASRGIGAVYADRLAKRGYDLTLVARNEARLQELSARLTKETGRSVTPLRADLSDKAELAKVESVLRVTKPSPCSSTTPASVPSHRCWMPTLRRWTT